MSLLNKARTQIAKSDWVAARATCEAYVREHGGIPEAAYLLGLCYLNTREPARAAAILERLAESFPDHADTLGALHSAYLEAGEPRKAATPLQRLCELSPDNVSLRRQLASVLISGDKPGEASALCEEILEKDPRDVGALIILSSARRLTRQHEQAKEAAQKAKELAPEKAEPLVAMGHAHLAAGNAAKAVDELQAAKQYVDQKNPATLAEIMDGIAWALARSGRLNDALSIYQKLEKELPNHVESRMNHGRVWLELGHMDKALAQVAKAINLQPGGVRPRVLAAEILLEQNRLADARAHLERVLDADPPIGVLTTLGAVEIKELDLQNALEHFDQALAIDPDHPGALFGYVSAAQRACYWNKFEARLNHYLKLYRDNPSWQASPWMFINLPHTTPLDHLECANRQSRSLAKGQRKQRKSHEGKIRVGLPTWDFHTHPTGRLIAELLEKRDQETFEWHLFYWGPIVDDPLQKRLFDNVDEIHHVHQMNDNEAAEAMRDAGIDVLLDLMGYTAHARPRIVAAQPAPVQVSWLGHAQTLGEGMADFIVLDDVLCPEGEEDFFAEHVLRMPHTYFPTPRKQEHAPAGTREQHSLPGDSIVFGCFNQSLKITPESFDLWIRILRNVPNSVLWLLEDNAHSVENLRKTAVESGVEASRLIFAPKVSHDKHLGRLAHMDLMLDTLTYNGHTTTSDALSRHVPVITCPGETFPSRVAASLLKACELDELICSDTEEYVKLATMLGNDKKRLVDLKQHLADKHDELPLFDSDSFTRSFESLMKSALAQAE